MSRIILASASPQRKTLLAGLGVRFDVVASSVDEDAHPMLDPVRRSAELAMLKAKDVAAKNRGGIVIGCDTLVVASDGTLLEKPTSPDDAKRMIALQSGKTSLVHSALCVIDAKGNVREGVSSSDVTFKKLTDKDVEWWISTGLWKDRSGAFQIDGLGQLMIAEIKGDWTSIVGLPVFLLGRLMEEAGARIG